MLYTFLLEKTPEGAQTVESDHGAMYYIPPEESLSPEQEEAVDHFEDFLNDIDPSDVQDPRTDSDPEEREALEIWSEYTQGEIGEQEFAERTEEFIEDWAGETLE